MVAPINCLVNVRAHGTNVLKVVYTNDSTTMPTYLAQLNGWLAAGTEQERFIGLDLEYTANQKEVAVIQLAHKKNVLVFQWAKYEFWDFS